MRCRSEARISASTNSRDASVAGFTRGTRGRRKMSDDVRVVAHHEAAVRHFGGECDRLTHIRHVALRCDGDLVRHVAGEPAKELSPEGDERLIVDRDLGAHLPEEGVLDRKRDGDSLPEALVAEHWL